VLNATKTPGALRRYYVFGLGASHRSPLTQPGQFIRCNEAWAWYIVLTSRADCLLRATVSTSTPPSLVHRSLT
jgi:hypothetical protein